jgi:hypothetical protein
MNKALRSASWIFTSFFLFMLVSTLALSGCKEGADSEPPINLDSVKPHVIPIGLAIQYTANFRASIDSFNHHCAGFKDSMQFGHAEAFNSDVINLLLKQKNAKGDPAVGIRIYYGRDNAGMIKMILVPYDKYNNDIINVLVDLANKNSGVSPAHTEALKVGGDGQTVEEGQHCPTICDDGSSGLNGSGN